MSLTYTTRLPQWSMAFRQRLCIGRGRWILGVVFLARQVDFFVRKDMSDMCCKSRNVLDCCCWCLFIIWYLILLRSNLHVDCTWICFHVSIVRLLFCSWIHPEATYGQKWTWKLVDDRIRSLWGVTGRFGRNATWHVDTLTIVDSSESRTARFGCLWRGKRTICLLRSRAGTFFFFLDSELPHSLNRYHSCACEVCMLLYWLPCCF